MTLRPIGPRDASVLKAYLRGLSANSCYHRFFGARYELPPAELDRVIHLDRKCELFGSPEFSAKLTFLPCPTLPRDLVERRQIVNFREPA